MLKPRVHAAPALLLAAAVLAAGCGAGKEPHSTTSASSFPVVLITLDGFASERLAAFGGEGAAPTIERLVEGGAAWADGWTVCPMTRPAVATYLTGVAPDRHGVRDDLFTPLGEEWPTLATALNDRSYHTAAFPDSALLGAGSGVLRGFSTVNDPPMIPIGPGRWIPVVRDPAEIATNFGVWLDQVPAGEGYFAWLHFSGLLRAQFVAAQGSSATDGPIKERLREARAGEDAAEGEGAADENIEGDLERPIDEIDAAIGGILAALELRGDLDDALILVAGTSATLGGKSAIGGRGTGFSLDEASIRVPVIARFPVGSDSPRPSGKPVWAPDVPATIADLAGVELSDAAEGVSLLAATDDARALFAWSWATMDQMGWVPLRAVRSGEWKRMEGWGLLNLRLDGAEGEAGPEVEGVLVEALATRQEPEGSGFDPSVLGEWARAHDLELRPLPRGGREFGPEENRKQAARLLWRGRAQSVIHRPMVALTAFKRALEQDPENLGALLDRGQLLVLAQKEDEALPLLRQAVELYPHETELWHWLAHAVWQSDSWEEALPVLEAILPYQSSDADVLYDLACAHSLGGELESSAEFLERAIQAGFVRWDQFENDADLRNLRESPLFSEVLRNYGR